MATVKTEFASREMPTMGNGVTRAIGRGLLKLTGWKMSGKLPAEKKVIIIGAPHTSNWDFIIAMACILALGVKITWMMKKEAFFWPLAGVWKSLGGVPTDRGGRNDVIAQMANWIKSADAAWLGITPEGTRSKVEKYKKGYLRIAYAAGIPVFIVALDGKNKQVVFDKLFPLTFDTETDNRKIKAYYDKTYKGIKPELG